MKIKYFILLCGVMVSFLFLVGCGSDDEADVQGIDYERVYMVQGGSVEKYGILKTPVGYFGTMNAKMEITTTADLKTATTSHVTIDPSLTSSYNDKNGTDYATIPDGVVTLDKNTLTVPSGATVSDTLTLSASKEGYAKLENGKSYLIPVTMQDASGSIAHLAMDLKYRTRYFVLTYNETSSILINDPTKDDIKGVPTTKAEGKSWKCIAADNLNPNEYENMFGGWRSMWKILKGKEQLTASFTIDFGSTHNISAFNIECYVMKSVKMEISSDDNQWSEIANTVGGYVHSVYDDNWDSWYVMYAAVPARYVRFTLTLDPDTWAWNSYRGINGLSFRFQD